MRKLKNITRLHTLTAIFYFIFSSFCLTKLGTSKNCLCSCLVKTLFILIANRRLQVLMFTKTNMDSTSRWTCNMCRSMTVLSCIYMWLEIPSYNHTVFVNFDKNVNNREVLTFATQLPRAREENLGISQMTRFKNNQYDFDSCM